MLLRVGVGALLASSAGGWPWHTLVVNVVGSLCLGVLAARMAPADGGSPLVEAFLGPGLLASFTTYSTFAVETNRLLAEQPLLGVLYAGASVAGGIAAARLGLGAGRR